MSNWETVRIERNYSSGAEDYMIKTASAVKALHTRRAVDIRSRAHSGFVLLWLKKGNVAPNQRDLHFFRLKNIHTTNGQQLMEAVFERFSDRVFIFDFHSGDCILGFLLKRGSTRPDMTIADLGHLKSFQI